MKPSPTESFLLRHGWARGAKPGVWLHPELLFPWPQSDAVRLTNEAIEGDARALLLIGQPKKREAAGAIPP